MSPEHFRNLITGIVLIIGSLLTASWALTESNNWMHIQNSAGKTSALVVDTYPGSSALRPDKKNVSVTYSVDDKIYSGTLKNYSATAKTGDTIYVYYLKYNPSVTVNRPEYLDILYTLAAVQLLVGVLILIVDPGT